MERKEMDLSAVQVEEVQNVLNSMQKVLECPICLELIKEPVSTKCDHIFCKFCMLKLLDQKKGPSQCPLCKSSITKRSLQESTRFGQLVEELLKTIHAFELDCSSQVENSYNFTKKGRSSPEHVKEEISIIQSMGYRNRAKRLQQNEPGNPALQETGLGAQLSDLAVSRPLRTKQQVQPPSKSVYIELGSDSSEDSVSKSYQCSVRDQGLLFFTPQAAKAEGGSDSAKQIEAACEVSEHRIADAHHPQPGSKAANATKRHRGGCISDLSVEPCGTKTRASLLQHASSRSLPTKDSTGAETAESCDKSEQPGPVGSQHSRWAKHAGSCVGGRAPSTEHAGKREEQNSLCSEALGETQDVSWVTLNSSIQKVNEWFSKSDDTVTSDHTCDRESESDAEEACALPALEDSEGLPVSSMKIDSLASDAQKGAAQTSRRACPKAAEGNVQDQVFGKTYGRKTGPPSMGLMPRNQAMPTLAAAAPLTPKQPLCKPVKRRSRASPCLHPEDFIKQADLAVAQEPSEKKPRGTGQMAESSQVTNIPNDSHEDKTDGGNVQRQKDPDPEQSLENVSTSSTRAEPGSSMCHTGPELSMRCSQALQKGRLGRRSSASQVPCRSLLDLTELQTGNSASSERIMEKGSQKVPSRCRRKLRLSRHLEASIGTEESKKPGEQGRERRAGAAGPAPRSANVPSSLTNTSSPAQLKEFVSSDLQKEVVEENPEAIRVSSSTRDLRDPGLSGEKGLQTGQSAGSTSVSLVPDTDCSSQGSTSLLGAAGCGLGWRVPQQYVAQYVAVTEPQELPPDARGGTEGSGDPLSHEVSHAQEVVSDMEDSELDTQYLQNMFQASRRRSFALFSNSGNPEKGPTKARACPESLEKQSPEVTEHEQIEGTGREGRAAHRVAGALGPAAPSGLEWPGARAPCSIHWASRLCPSAQAGGDGTEPLAADTLGIPQNPHHRLSASVGQAQPALPEEFGSESILQGAPSTRRHTPQEAGSGLGSGSGSGPNEVGSSGGHGPAALRRPRALELDAVLRSGLLQPETCRQSLPGGHCQHSEAQRPEASTALAPAACAGFPPGLIVENVARSAGRSPSTQDCFETPDDLLDDRKDDASLAEGDIKETSAVFSKSVQRRQLSRSPSPLTHGASARGLRRRVRKLESSQEDMSSEDEELPCFQHLLFGKGTGTPQSTKPSTLVTDHVSKGTEGSMGSLKTSFQDCTRQPAALVTIEASPEPQLDEDIRCSGSLFSSQCSAVEDSATNTDSQDPFLTSHAPAKLVERHSGSQGVALSDRGAVSDDEDGKTGLEIDGHHSGRSVQPHSDEAASGYESEADHSDASSGLSSQSSLLTTQQRDTIQDNLLKLQQEMAHLEAVLERQGSQHSDRSVVPDSCPSEQLLALGSQAPGRGLALEGSNRYPVGRSSPAPSANEYHESLHCPTPEGQEPGAGRASPPGSHVASGRRSAHSQPRRLQDRSRPAPEQLAEAACVGEKGLGESELHHPMAPAHLPHQKPVGTSVPASGATLFPDSPEPTAAKGGAPSAQKLPQGQVAQPAWSPAAAQSPNPAGGASREEDASTGLVPRRASLVVSGLSARESMLVQKFARKHHMALTSVVTEETTHVVMKTDADLVCERTLKYFLGIAGGKWVVSYLWVSQSMKASRVLDECDFEVRGDVINGKSHQGPRRARESQDKRIFRGLDVYCYGPFTNMPTDQLEWMLQLCGATVAKELSSLPLGTGAHAIVVAQPDAWTEEDGGFPALGQLCQAPVVTREWVLDSVALHQRQELDAYLVPQGPHRPH